MPLKIMIKQYVPLIGAKPYHKNYKSQTCLYRTLNKTEFCINRTLNKVPL